MSGAKTFVKAIHQTIRESNCLVNCSGSAFGLRQYIAWVGSGST